jgi:hypothetical protein
MNTATVSFLMSMITLLCWRPSDAAIDCYLCTSDVTGCDDPSSLSGNLVGSCPSNSCSKSTATVKGEHSVVRACGMIGENGCVEVSGTSGSGSYCECSTALCNTAAPVITVTSLVGLTAAAASTTVVAIVRAL